MKSWEEPGDEASARLPSARGRAGAFTASNGRQNHKFGGKWSSKLQVQLVQKLKRYAFVLCWYKWKTEEQLEQMLADRRLCREQSLLSGSATNTVRAEDDDVLAVGPTKVSLSKPLLFYPSCNWTSPEPEWMPTTYV